MKNKIIKYTKNLGIYIYYQLLPTKWQYTYGTEEDVGA